VSPGVSRASSDVSSWTWALVSVGVAGAVGYGVYEWRHEIAKASKRFVSKLGKK
jgi:hypothetical protein